MHIRVTTSPIVPFLLLLLCLSSGFGFGFGFSDGARYSSYSLEQDHDRYKVSRRMLVEMEAVLDYDDPGANTKHDPKGKKPGNGGGKNP